VLERSRIVGHGVLNVSWVSIVKLTCEVMSLRRLASIYVVGTTRRKYWNIVKAKESALNRIQDLRLGVLSILMSKGCEIAGKYGPNENS
jgi:hypothetical protein